MFSKDIARVKRTIQRQSSKEQSTPSHALSAAGRALKKPARRGQSLVELALTLPFLMLILAGLVDMGRGIHDYIIITNAAREGVRYASKDPTNVAVIRQYVQLEASGNGMTIADDQIAVTYPDNGDSSPGSPVRVRVQHSFTTILGAFVGFTELPIANYLEMIIL